ncbi:hypothetical protein C1H46_000255 [Malus baccata]|uniref:Uncharacterized protein n=1 Tax=Malus baccata TaxID=106549 RepID=A0A540NTH2_MALBA|nr:hypothetical protein C1H46_000255 [Malus baccata]
MHRASIRAEMNHQLSINYYETCLTPEAALVDPPQELLERVRVGVALIHFKSENYQKKSATNIENQDKKPYDHHFGSRPPTLLGRREVREKFLVPVIWGESHANHGNELADENLCKCIFVSMVWKKDEYVANLCHNHPDVPVEELTLDLDVSFHVLMDKVG